MQPRSTVTFDRATFDRLKRRVGGLASRRAGTVAEVPTQIGIKLNNGCNLRCAHCFEWNPDGYHRAMSSEQSKEEIPLKLIQQVMQATEKEKSDLYLWGGEPLMYSEFDGLMQLLEGDPRWTTICTNATLLDKRLDSMLRASRCLAFLASLEGLGEVNDAIRGKGTFRRVTSAILLLLRLRQEGVYKGAISVSLTINDHVIGGLFSFIKYFEDVGVDSVYLVFPWFIPARVAGEMDAFVASHLPKQASTVADWGATSWHSFSYRISPEKLPELHDDLARVAGTVWTIRVRLHPALEEREINSFVLGGTDPAEHKTRCSSINNRVDLLPNGDIVSCKFFPETRMGNIKISPLAEIWHGEAYSSFRKSLSCGLSPVCSKCTLLYSTG